MSFKKYMWERFKKSFSLNKIYEHLKGFLLVFIVTLGVYLIFFGLPMLISFVLGVIGLSSNWEATWQIITIMEFGALALFVLFHSIKEKIKEMKSDWRWENEK